MTVTLARRFGAAERRLGIAGNPAAQLCQIRLARSATAGSGAA